MKRIISLALCLALGFSLMAGCTVTEKEETTTPSESESTTAAPTNEEKELTKRGHPFGVLRPPVCGT